MKKPIIIGQPTNTTWSKSKREKYL